MTAASANVPREAATAPQASPAPARASLLRQATAGLNRTRVAAGNALRAGLHRIGSVLHLPHLSRVTCSGRVLCEMPESGGPIFQEMTAGGFHAYPLGGLNPVYFACTCGEKKRNRCAGFESYRKATARPRSHTQMQAPSTTGDKLHIGNRDIKLAAVENMHREAQALVSDGRYAWAHLHPKPVLVESPPEIHHAEHKAANCNCKGDCLGGACVHRAPKNSSANWLPHPRMLLTAEHARPPQAAPAPAIAREGVAA